jgi:hypothetical protein
MPRWLSYLIPLLIVLIIAPAIGWLGHSQGAKIKRGAAMASLLLGFGMPFDPPSRHLIEAKEGEEKGPDAAGDPPQPESQTPGG